MIFLKDPTTSTVTTITASHRADHIAEYFYSQDHLEQFEYTILGSWLATGTPDTFFDTPYRPSCRP